MIKVYSDLLEWSFEIDEVSAGVYEVTASDNRGRRVSSKGTDPDALLKFCREQAMRLAQTGGDAD